MIGTLFSSLIALFILFNPSVIDSVNGGELLSLTLFISAALIVLAGTLTTVFAWGPLQQIEQNLIPGLMKSFRQDKQLRLNSSLILGFLLFTFVVVINTWFIHLLNKTYLLAAWAVFLGLTVDFLHHLVNRIMSYLDPQEALNLLENKALKSIRLSHEVEICNWIDTFSEVGIKSASKTGVLLCLASSEKLVKIGKNYLEVAKRITYHEDKSEDEKAQGQNHVNYTMFYLLGRLEMIFDKCLEKKLEPVVCQLVTSFGKLTISSANYDISFADYPLHYLIKLTEKAQKQGFHEAGNHAILTLLEVSRTIVNQMDLTYLEIQDTFFEIIVGMHEISKNLFKQNKNIDIDVLIEPLHDLKKLFQTEKMTKHADTSVIIQAIDDASAEFDTLKTVMNTMPSTEEILDKKNSVK